MKKTEVELIEFDDLATLDGTAFIDFSGNKIDRLTVRH